MLPTSLGFYLYIALAFLLYWAVARVRTLRHLVLLAASLFFLARFALFYPVLLTVAALTDYAVGLLLGAIKPHRTLLRGTVFSVSVLLNLALLITPKILPGYLPHQWTWIFPLSLSFYSFQAISYTADVYAGKTRPERNALCYLTAATFFATLMAGPITRLSLLVNDLRKSPGLKRDEGSSALLQIVVGLLKKLLIANYLADNLVNRIWDTPSLYSGLEVATGILAYALQIYFDFSGYSDIAIGVGKLFGVHLPANFNQPYVADSIRDFWRRWHISFSSWLRDYLYIPLGGSHCAKVRTAINLMVTMLLAGLWHGISWCFLLWGAVHGCALVVAHLFRRRQKNAPPVALRLLSGAATFLFVVVAWIPFRAPSLDQMFEVLARLSSFTFEHDNLSADQLSVLAFSTVLVFVAPLASPLLHKLYVRMPMLLQGTVLAGFLIALEMLAGHGSSNFVYQNF